MKCANTYPSLSEPSSVSRLLFPSSSNSEPSERPSEKASSPESPECTPRVLGRVLPSFFSLRFNFLVPRPSRADSRLLDAESSLPRRSSTDFRVRSRTLSIAVSIEDLMSAESSPGDDVRLMREGVEALSAVAGTSCLPCRSRDTLRELAVAPRGSVAGIDLAVQEAKAPCSRISAGHQ